MKISGLNLSNQFNSRVLPDVEIRMTTRVITRVFIVFNSNMKIASIT